MKIFFYKKGGGRALERVSKQIQQRTEKVTRNVKKGLENARAVSKKATQVSGKTKPPKPITPTQSRPAVTEKPVQKPRVQKKQPTKNLPAVYKQEPMPNKGIDSQRAYMLAIQGKGPENMVDFSQIPFMRNTKLYNIENPGFQQSLQEGFPAILSDGKSIFIPSLGGKSSTSYQPNWEWVGPQYSWPTTTSTSITIKNSGPEKTESVSNSLLNRFKSAFDRSYNFTRKHRKAIGISAIGIPTAMAFIGNNGGQEETSTSQADSQTPPSLYRYAGGKWYRLGDNGYQDQTAEYGKDRNGDINYYSEEEGQWIPEGNYGLREDGSVVDTQGNVIGYDPTYQNYVNSVGKNEKPLNAIDYYQALAEELNFDSPEKIKKFQQKMDIPDDGIFGPQTLAAYRKLNFGARQQLLGQSYRNGGKLGMLRDSIERAGSKLFS